MSDRDVIVINGRQYSAITGKPIANQKNMNSDITPQKINLKGETIRASSVMSVDNKTDQTPKKIVPVQLKVDNNEGKVFNDISRRSFSRAQHLHKRVQHPSNNAAENPTKPSIDTAKSSTNKIEIENSEDRYNLGLKQSESITKLREERARQVARSHHISKFGKSHQVETDPMQHINVIKQPPQTPLDPVEGANESPENYPSINTSRQSLAERVEAINAATVAYDDKEQNSKSWKLPKLSFRTVAVLIVLMVVSLGVFAYTTTPDISIKVASNKAGIEARLPDYRPEGFHFSGPVAYSPGSVTLTYGSSAGDGRKVRIIERKSDWDSESLEENFVSLQADNYITHNVRGIKIFIWEGSKATWVNGGIWYTIEGDSLIGSSEVLKIASSIQ